MKSTYSRYTQRGSEFESRGPFWYKALSNTVGMQYAHKYGRPRMVSGNV